MGGVSPQRLRPPHIHDLPGQAQKKTAMTARNSAVYATFSGGHGPGSPTRRKNYEDGLL